MQYFILEVPVETGIDDDRLAIMLEVEVSKALRGKQVDFVRVNPVEVYDPEEEYLEDFEAECNMLFGLKPI